MQAKMVVSLLSLNCLAFLSSNAAYAQAIEYDQVYPQGARQTLIEKNSINTETAYPTLRGSVREDFDTVKTKIRRRHHREPVNDTVYGKTIELDIGMGGAHFD